VQGELWGARARNYADFQEPQLRSLHEHALRHTGVGQGRRVLDVGCGPGGFCRQAADARAAVAGIDASQAHIEIARERVPAGSFDVADMQFLPYEDRSFDVVTGFNSIQYAADPVAALREARRVTKPGGSVHIVVWGREHTELAPRPPSAAAAGATRRTGTLRALPSRRARSARHTSRPHTNR
jgi:ubiquinone/menaquinone biosynthesis C-methylase UbiE